MYELLIWDINGECTTIYCTEDMLEYEEQVLDSDLFVKEYSVSSL